MIRMGMIGTNFISDWMAAAVSETENIEFTAVCSRTMEKGREFASSHGIPVVYDSYDDLAADPDIDAVYIASPTMCHFDHAMLMLKHGKHVLCEKPVCSNLRQAEELMEYAVSHGLVFMEAMKNVHQPGFEVIKEGLEKIGPVRLADISFCQYSSRYDNFKNGIIQNAFRSELSNGALMDVGSYCAHFMAGLFGMPEKILSDCVKLSNGCDGAGTAVCRYPDMLVKLSYSKISDAPLPSSIQGEKGSIIIDYCPTIKHVKIIYRTGQTEEYDFGDGKDHMIYEVRDFVKLVENHDADHRFLKCSRIEMMVTDTVRKQNDIRFPADDM